MCLSGIEDMLHIYNNMSQPHQVKNDGVMNQGWKPKVGRPKKAESDGSISSDSKNNRFCSAELIMDDVYTIEKNRCRKKS